MFSKTIFVLATVCVVNASVLTVNVFDDDPETQDASNPKDCNFQECDQLCRRLQFPGGACVNGRCKCDNFLNAEDGTENTFFSLENSVLQKDDPEAEVKANPRRCIVKVCDLVCRWLNKTSGSCVDGRCKCVNSIDTMTDFAESLSLSSCNSIVCDDQCRRTGWHSGVCINGQCKCDYFLNTEDIMTDPTESLQLFSCNSITCYDQCRRTGWQNGFCVNGQCKCNYFLNTEGAVTGNTLSNLEDSISPRRCTYQACNELCRKHNFPGGACVNGRCRCDNSFEREDAVDDYSEFAPRRVCRLTKCVRKCIRRGYEGATCVNGRCKCYSNLQEKDASPLNDVTSEENEESLVVLRTNEEELVLPSPRACNTVTCNQMCHRLNYAGGWCRFGQCQCY